MNKPFKRVTWRPINHDRLVFYYVKRTNQRNYSKRIIVCKKDVRTLGLVCRVLGLDLKRVLRTV